MVDQGLGLPIWTQVIRRRPPSQNDFTARWKSERQGYRAISRIWGREFHRCPLKLAADGPRTVQFTRIIGKRERAFDGGNFVGGIKPILDWLVRFDYLVDDAPNLCLDLYRQIKNLSATWDSSMGRGIVEPLAGPALVIELWNGIQQEFRWKP